MRNIFIQNTLDVSKTLVVILGLGKCTHWRELGSDSFVNSARTIREYFLKPRGYNLPEDNLLDLFNDKSEPITILIKIHEFIITKTITLIPEQLIFYYVGHGGFPSSSQEYSLALSGTRKKPFDGLTMLAVKDLANVLYDANPRLSRFIIIDACASAAAFPYFAQEINVQAIEQGTFAQIPKNGTALLAAASKNKAARTVSGATYTMFSDALLDVLYKGEPSPKQGFTLPDIRDLVEERIKQRYPGEGVRPEVHVPNQIDGDISKFVVFPNPGAKEAFESIMKTARSYIGENDFDSARTKLHELESNLAAFTKRQLVDFYYLMLQ